MYYKTESLYKFLDDTVRVKQHRYLTYWIIYTYFDDICEAVDKFLILCESMYESSI